MTIAHFTVGSAACRMAAARHQPRRSLRRLAACAIAIAAMLTGSALSGAEDKVSISRSASAMPSDIDPQSGFRLPLPRREDLDDTARQTFDESAKPGSSIAGLQGPAGVQLYSPKTTRHLRAINHYLRFEAGFAPRVR